MTIRSAIPPYPRRRRSPPSSASFWKATALPCMATRPQAAPKEAQQAVADDLTQRSGDTIRPENIFFTCGAAPALVAVLRALAVEDAEFVAIAPYFPEYQVFVSYNGGKFVEVPPDTKNFQVDIAAVERALTPHTQAVLVNSPNNPSGVIYSRETLTALGALLERKSAEYGHPIYIIADEPYRELVYDNAEVPYIPGIYRDTVICYSYSKSLSMPGERIGYVCIPDSVTDSAKLHAAVAGASRAFGHVRAPSMMQRVIARATGLRPDLEAYDENRHTLYNALSEMGYECVKPEGAFYMMVKAPGGDAHAFSERAKKENLLLVPADSFGCPGFFPHQHLRRSRHDPAEPSRIPARPAGLRRAAHLDTAPSAAWSSPGHAAACHKSPFGPFRQAAFQNCKIRIL